MSINKQFVFYDENFIPNPFEVLEKRINNYDTNEVPHKMGVYIIEKENNKIYIGKSTNIYGRLRDHEIDGKIRTHDNFTFFTSEHFNESHISTLETKLINHSKYANEEMLINIRKDQKEHEYFNKSGDEKIYSGLLKEFHDNFLKDITGVDFQTISSTQEYKISPKAKQLTREQFGIVDKIMNKEMGEGQIFLITGSPGTGKSVVASNLADKLNKDGASILLTSGLTNLNSSFKRVFHDDEYENISVENVGKATNDFYNYGNQYDFVIVDEGHRLKKKGTGKAMPLSTQHIRNHNELEDLIKMGKNIIILFDKNQISMPADITTKEMLLTLKESGLTINNHSLNTQIRNDTKFEEWINKLLNSEDNFTNDSSIEIKIHDDFNEMYSQLKTDKKKFSTILMSTPYLKNDRKNEYHFNIDSVQLRWSAKDSNWTETKAAQNLEEVGYVNNVQGKDFESVGLIIGNDFYWESSKLKVDIKNQINHFQFVKGKTKENYENAINRLRVFLSRTTKKIHLYVVDKNLRNHIKKNI